MTGVCLTLVKSGGQYKLLLHCSLYAITLVPAMMLLTYSVTTANHTPRFVARKKLHPNDSIGLTLIGGNAVGIFVRDVVPGSLLDGANGVQCGDQILQVLLCLSCSKLMIVC